MSNNSTSNATTTTASGPTSVANYIALAVPAPAMPYDKNGAVSTNNLVAFTAALNSRLEDAIYFSKISKANAVAAGVPNATDFYQLNHWVQWSTNFVPA